jgi:hypothetical protein
VVLVGRGVSGLVSSQLGLQQQWVEMPLPGMAMVKARAYTINSDEGIEEEDER